MPYKDVENRRLAWKRWRDKHIEVRRELVRVQKQASYANPVIKVCSVKDCTKQGERHHPDYSKPKEIVWMCKQHHEALHSIGTCKVKGCESKHLARGMCQKHYSRWRRSK